MIKNKKMLIMLLVGSLKGEDISEASVHRSLKDSVRLMLCICVFAWIRASINILYTFNWKNYIYVL